MFGNNIYIWNCFQVYDHAVAKDDFWEGFVLSDRSLKLQYFHAPWSTLTFFLFTLCLQCFVELLDIFYQEAFWNEMVISAFGRWHVRLSCNGFISLSWTSESPDLSVGLISFLLCQCFLCSFFLHSGLSIVGCFNDLRELTIKLCTCVCWARLVHTCWFKRNIRSNTVGWTPQHVATYQNVFNDNIDMWDQT